MNIDKKSMKRALILTYLWGIFFLLAVVLIFLSHFVFHDGPAKLLNRTFFPEALVNVSLLYAAPIGAIVLFWFGGAAFMPFLPKLRGKERLEKVRFRLAIICTIIYNCIVQIWMFNNLIEMLFGKNDTNLLVDIRDATGLVPKIFGFLIGAIIGFYFGHAENQNE